MFTPFKNFLQVRYKYCISYFGNSNEYIELLKLLRPFIESQFRGIQIHLTCKDDAYYLLKDEPRVCPKSKFNKTDYCYVREINFENGMHPVELIMHESDIKIPTISTTAGKSTSDVYVYTFGNVPTRSLSTDETCYLMKKIENNGRKCHMNKIWDGISSVISVENETLVRAAAQGVDCTLLDRGIGTNLYKKLFSHLKVLSL